MQTAARLFAAVARLNVMARLSRVALALVDLREKSRLEPDLPAKSAGLTTTELRVLRHPRRRPLPTVHGTRGLPDPGRARRAPEPLGHGPPGWQTRWLGRRRLRLLVEGVNRAAQLRDE